LQFPCTSLAFWEQRQNRPAVLLLSPYFSVFRSPLCFRSCSLLPPRFCPFFFSSCRFSFSGFYNQRMSCSRMDFNAIKASVFFFFRVKKMNSVNINGHLHFDPWHFDFLRSSLWVNCNWNPASQRHLHIGP